MNSRTIERSAPRVFDLETIRSAVRRARELAAVNTEEREVFENLEEIVEGGFVKTGTAANILGVSSITSVKNWIAAGLLPGARKGPGGQWLLPVSELIELRAEFDATADRNRRKDRSIPVTEEYDHETMPVF